MASVKQGRKVLFTINNPQNYQITHDTIISKISSLKSLKYACISDEIGGKGGTYHTHIFVYWENPKNFNTLRKLFDEHAHIDFCVGTCKQNRDYVFKEGKWEDTEKGNTKVPCMQIEYGELPEEQTCPEPMLELLYELIKDGHSNAEILEQHPEYLKEITTMDRVRLTILQERYKETFRKLEVTYMFGKTGTGKSRGIMQKYGYSNVFRVTDYLHPFDTYSCEDVVVFEEFSSTIKITDMLNYLDGYPLKLPARYSDKIACYTKVYICTNTKLEEQYPNIQKENAEVWSAFLRRITKVVWYKSESEIETFHSIDEYQNRNFEFKKITEEERNQLPFD